MEIRDLSANILETFQECLSLWLMMFFLIILDFPGLSINSIPVVLFIILCLHDWSEVKKIYYENRLAIWLMLVPLIIGVLFSYRPEKSIKSAYNFLRGALIFFPVLYLIKKDLPKIKKPLVWVPFLCSVLYLSYFVVAKATLPENKVYAYLAVHLDNPNIYGTSLALIVLVSLFSLLFLKNSRIELLILFLSIIFSFLMFPISSSRGSWLALFFGVFSLLIIRCRHKLVAFCSFSLIGLILTVVIARLRFPSWAHLMSFWKHGLELRGEIYSTALANVVDKELWFGFGLNTYKYLGYGLERAGKTFAHPHNIYVELIFSVGVVGSLFVIGAFCAFLNKSFFFSFKSPYPALGLALICFMLVRGLTDLKFFDAEYPGVLAIAFALILGSKNWDNDSC